jgi:glucose/arabinose dehydrogenase
MITIPTKFVILFVSGCLLSFSTPGQEADVDLPEPYATKSVTNHPSVTGWIEGKKPTAPDGFTVVKFADGFENPRWIYEGPNGDLFIAESSTSANSANRITILQDKDQDGTFDTREIFLQNLNKPFGMLILGVISMLRILTH